MTANPLSSLPKQKREMQRQIASKQKEIEQLRKKIGKIDKVLADAQQLSGEVGGDETKQNNGGESGGGAQQRRTGARPGEIISAVREILNSANSPLTRGQLLAALDSLKIEVGGTNPANKLGTTLSREEDIFVNLPRFGFWLKSRNYPPAEYVAETGGKEKLGEATSGQIAAHVH